MAKQQELSRFTGSGKTFFFNKGKAKNDTTYLAINAIYGQGNRERMILFPPHYMEFYNHLRQAITELTGFEPSDKRLVETCPHCGSGPAKLRVESDATGAHWCMFCGECLEILFENTPGAYEKYIAPEEPTDG